MTCSASGTISRIVARSASSVLRFGSSIPRRYASTSSADTVAPPLRRFEFTPAADAVVGDDLLEHRGQGGLVDGLAAVEADRARGLVPVAGGDDPFRIQHDPAVVE